MDPSYKFSLHFSGLNHNIDLEKDKCMVNHEQQLRLQQQQEEMKQAAQNSLFNPKHMEFHIRNDVSHNIFDPTFMSFDID